VTSADGVVTLAIPPGALPDGVAPSDLRVTRNERPSARRRNVTAEQALAGDFGDAGEAPVLSYRLEPAGITFAVPLIATIRLEETQLTEAGKVTLSSSEGGVEGLVIIDARSTADGVREIDVEVPHFSDLEVFQESILSSARIVAPAASLFAVEETFDVAFEVTRTPGTETVYTCCGDPDLDQPDTRVTIQRVVSGRWSVDHANQQDTTGILTPLNLPGSRVSADAATTMVMVGPAGPITCARMGRGSSLNQLRSTGPIETIMVPLVDGFPGEPEPAQRRDQTFLVQIKAFFECVDEGLLLYCGDGWADTEFGEEECDGTDLDGQTCASLGMMGTLACDAECRFTGCSPRTSCDAAVESLSTDILGDPTLGCSSLRTDLDRECTEHTVPAIGCQEGQGDHTEFRALGTVVAPLPEAGVSILDSLECGRSVGTRLLVCPPASPPPGGGGGGAGIPAGDYAALFAVLEGPVPPAGSTHCEYAFVFDSDGDPANNYVAAPMYPNDFFQGTDRWYVARHTPAGTWSLVATDTRDGSPGAFATGARIVVQDDTVMALIPLGELFVSGPPTRVTAFCHDGGYGIDGGYWAGDLEPPVDEGFFACCETACGNGRREPGELCDDGNTTAGDGCSADCDSDESCGNGIVDTTTGETCDDGNVMPGDGCDAACAIEPPPAGCGDGTLDTTIGEECDDGNTAAGDGCSPSCDFEPGPRCGDGAIDPGESCDDAGTAGGDGCSARCATEIAVQGRSVARTGAIAATDPTYTRRSGCGASAAGSFHHDLWVLENATGAAQTLTIDAAWSSDGYLVAYSWPFDPAMPVTGCLAGNDDFGGTGGSRLTAVAIPAGERIVVVATTYAATATIASYTLTVRTDGVAPVVCGDGLIEGSEGCDDGGTAGGDGCSATCAVEAGWACSGAPSVCALIVCGDGAITGGEGCDDGNAVSGDGCSARCNFEIAAPGASVSIMGGIAGTDPTFTRPSGCGTLSPGSYHHDTWTLENTTGASRTLTIDAAWSSDGYLFAYRWPFDATMPLTGCAAANDDFGSTTASRVSGVTIADGERIVVVATTYGSASTLASYTLTAGTD
jgi:cysteine-rich repeat protein